MDATGNSREGWMALIPLSVITFIIMYVVGGPAAFVHFMQQWISDVVTYVADVIKYL